jgi:tight adherence protein C
MSSALVISIAVFAGIGALIYGLYMFMTPKKTVVQQRLDGLKKGDADMSQVTIDASVERSTPVRKTMEAVGESLPLSKQTLSNVKLMLIHANFRRDSAPAIFFGAKAILAGGLFALLAMWSMSVHHDLRQAVIMGILGLVIGLLIPSAWLKDKIKRRQLVIFHTLPDVLDLMTVCVEAGLGLDAAIIKITEEGKFKNNVLALEFAQTSREIRAGKPRMDALRDMGVRTGVEDLKALVALLVQTERLGASLARSLRIHSDSLRTKRRQIAEEAAAKTPIKLVFPLAFFIFPALLVVLLGPAVIKMADQLFGHTLH